MGKKRSRASQTSQGKHCQKRTPSQKERRIEYKLSGERSTNQWRAFIKGKNVILTIPNPDKNNTKERFIKVPASEAWRR